MTLPPVLPQTLCKSNKLTYIRWNRHLASYERTHEHQIWRSREGSDSKQTCYIIDFIFSIALHRVSAVSLLSTTGSSDRKFQTDGISQWETPLGDPKFMRRISNFFFPAVRPNIGDLLWDVVTLIAESSFKSDNFGAQGKLLPQIDID